MRVLLGSNGVVGCVLRAMEAFVVCVLCVCFVLLCFQVVTIVFAFCILYLFFSLLFFDCWPEVTAVVARTASTSKVPSMATSKSTSISTSAPINPIPASTTPSLKHYGMSTLQGVLFFVFGFWRRQALAFSCFF